MSYRILVVEDNPMSRELLSDWLEAEGYEAVAVADLKASFDAIGMQPPQVVLLDINLGADNGISLVEWMRQNPEMREIPVIAVTASAMAADRERILKAGCNACLAKPIDFPALREELQRWVRNPKMSQAGS